MKYFLYTFVFVIILQTQICPAKATEQIAEHIDSNELFEEVVLSTPQINQSEEDNAVQAAGAEENVAEAQTLKEKLKNVYHLEVERYDHPEYLLREVLTHKCNTDSKMDNWHIWGAYNAYTSMNFIDDGGVNAGQTFNALNVGFDGFLKNNNGDFRIMLGFPVNSTRNYVQTLFSDVYIASNKIPHHRIQVGHFRPQVGMEGGNSAYTLSFLGRSQIARNFGTARRVGARIKGDYSYADYDFGIYSSDTFFEEFFPGAEFVGWVNIKPFAKKEEKLGMLKLGSGIDGGRRNDSFFVTGAYVGYEYKKLSAEFEWAHASGYNGYYGFSRKHASGFYTTIGYMLTKKLQLLACYDQFDPDRSITNNKQREYTLGLNYFIKGQALRVMLNYAFCQNDNAKDSHRIMLGTQILI